MLGYTPETVMLLHLVPLVQMVWAEGHVSDRERDLIIEAARSPGIEAGSPADRQLAGWLTERPSDELFEKTLGAIGAVLQARPAEEREASRRDLLSYCTAIASASGGVLGFRGPSKGDMLCDGSLYRCRAPLSSSPPAPDSSTRKQKPRPTTTCISTCSPQPRLRSLQPVYSLYDVRRADPHSPRRLPPARSRPAVLSHLAARTAATAADH